MAKQIIKVSLWVEKERLYTNNERSKQWHTHNDRNHSWHSNGESNKDDNKEKKYQRNGSFYQEGVLKNYSNCWGFKGKCYNYRKNGHIKKNFWFKKPI